jgi:hypothetical protein
LCSFFNCRYFYVLLSGIFVLTQHLNGKYCLFLPIWWEACYDTDNTSLMEQLFHCCEMKTAVKHTSFFTL